MKLFSMIDRLRGAMRRTRREGSTTAGRVRKAVRPLGKTDAPSPRPPTLMTDLLFDAPMLVAFLMGDPNPRPGVCDGGHGAILQQTRNQRRNLDMTADTTLRRVLLRENDKLRDIKTVLVAALESVEWRYQQGVTDRVCPTCARLEYAGHMPDCQLSAALAALAAAK